MPTAARWARYRRILNAAPATGAAAPSSLLTDLVGYWKLDEASGTRNDSHTNALHLTDNNTVTQEVGKVGSAAQFTAANSESLSRADEAALDTGDIDFTFAGWVYPDSVAGFPAILSKGDADMAGGEFMLFLNGGAPHWWARLLDDSNRSEILSTDVLSAGAWAHVLVYHDKTANVIGVQVNNGAAQTAAHATGVFVGTNAFTLGAMPGVFWGGRMDEWGFWKRLLTNDEKAALYNSGNGVTYPAFA